MGGNLLLQVLTFANCGRDVENVVPGDRFSERALSARDTAQDQSKSQAQGLAVITSRPSRMSMLWTSFGKSISSGVFSLASAALTNSVIGIGNGAMPKSR